MKSEALDTLIREYKIINAIARRWKQGAGKISDEEIITLSDMSGFGYADVKEILDSL
jgi:hypothetical protein